MSTSKDIEAFIAEREARHARNGIPDACVPSPQEAREIRFGTIVRELLAYKSTCYEALAMPSDVGPIDLVVGIRMLRKEADSIGQENAALRARLAELEPEAKAWRDGWEVLRELQARVMPCGHAMENLIRVGKHDVTTCGACLAAKQAAKVIEEPAIESDPHADCTLCNGTGWINGVVGSSCDVPNVGIAPTFQYGNVKL